MATLESIDTRAVPAASSETRVLLGGTLIGVLVGVGLAFLAFILGVVLVLARPELTLMQRDLVFLAPFGGAMLIVLGLLAFRGVRRAGGGVLVGVMVGAAATLAVLGGLLAGTAVQRL